MSTHDRPTSVGAQQPKQRESATEESDEQREPSEPTSEESVAEPTTELSLDVIFEILKNRRRRDVINYLRDREDRVSLGELAEHVAAIENDTTPEALTSSERKRVYVGLYQCHLPKMDDMGVVDFEQNRGYVKLAAGARSLEPYIDKPDDGAAIPWHQYYGAVATFGALVVVLAVAGVVSGGVELAMFGATVAMFGLCAGFQWLVDGRTVED